MKSHKEGALRTPTHREISIKDLKIVMGISNEDVNHRKSDADGMGESDSKKAFLHHHLLLHHHHHLLLLHHHHHHLLGALWRVTRFRSYVGPLRRMETRMLITETM